ncbi:MAG TPA: RagB/SusD family nutrient uptake outer membrane protein, partial [Puia sp.]|nr:RagB/SusD family nutrient uptake outer membrane protein [Puia sp.]
VNYNYKAYHSERPDQLYEVFDGDRSNCQKNLHILRYAEVLLIQAEARLHSGGDAATPLNAVRARAGLVNAPAVNINAVWNERRVELAMEHDRFWDLVRQGRAAQVMQASGKTGFVAGKNELLPIPYAEIQVSGGKLTQNNGY